MAFLLSGALLLLAPLSLHAARTTPLDCSLNGLCTGGACVCDTPWTGTGRPTACRSLQIAPGAVRLYDVPLCSFHGNSPNSTS